MPDVELRADYDHDGRLSGAQPEYDARSTAPGAIIVANVDVDRRALPTSVAGGSPVTLDYEQPTKSGADDELLAVSVRVVNPAAIAGQELLLRVSATQAIRVRVYDARGIIVQSPDPSRPGDHLLPPLGAVAPGTSVDFSLELRAYPGSPFGRGIGLATVFDPPATPERPFTIEVVGRDAARVETVFDSGMFTAAPILMLDNGAQALRLYICDTPDTQAALADVRSALPALGGVQLVTVPEAVANGDTWLQDQFQPGIVVGGDRSRQVIVHLPRLRANFFATQSSGNLAAFVTSHFPARDVGLLDDFWTRQMSFADASGRAVSLRFPDCVALSNAMGRVTSVVRALNDRAALIDNHARPDSGTWAELRAMLPQIAEAFVRRANAAKRVGENAWNRMLDDWIAGARAEVRLVTSATPAATTDGAFTLTAGRQSLELGGDLADRVFARVRQLESSGNYGGNIESTPPTPTAPLGHIVVGNARIDGEAEHVDPDVLALLHAQRQPVIQVDSTWLDVGHVDEMLAFVPRSGSGLPFAALRASPALALALVRGAANRYLAGLSPTNPQTFDDFRPSGVMSRLTATGPSPVTRLLRGKLWTHVHPTATGGVPPDVLEPPRIYQRLAQAMNGGNPSIPGSGGINIHGIDYWPGPGPDRVYPADITVLELLFCERDSDGASTNDFVERQFLAPLDPLLAKRIANLSLFVLPVLFDRTSSTAQWEQHRWSAATSAFTPDVVNLQVINGRLLMPRPYGPRMLPADARVVLEAVLQAVPGGEILRRQLTPSLLGRPELVRTVAWVQRHDPVYRTTNASGLVTRIADGLTSIDDVAKVFADGFPGLPAQTVARRIRAANAREFTPSGQLRDGWRRLVVDEGMVDLFEAYLQLVARALGLTIDWVDTWFYHTHFGGIHCGTNVLRAPRPGGPLPPWWR
jgi:hypothetical protein